MADATIVLYQDEKTRRLGMYYNNPNDFSITTRHTYRLGIPTTQDECIVRVLWTIEVVETGQVIDGELDMKWPFPLDSLTDSCGEEHRIH